MFDYFKNCSSNAHHVCCANSLTKSIYDHWQLDDLDFYSRSQLRLELDYFLICKISDNIQAITFKLGMAVDVYMTCIHMLVSMTVTLTLKTFKSPVLPVIVAVVIGGGGGGGGFFALVPLLCMIQVAIVFQLIAITSG